MVADPLRGEADITLAGKDYLLKLDLATIRQIEIMTGAGWQGLITRAFSGDLRLNDIAGVIWGGIIGGGSTDPPEFEEIAELVYAEGMVNTNMVVRELLTLQAIGQERAGEVAKMMEGLGGILQEEAEKTVTSN